jgi:hypothetical protein
MKNVHILPADQPSRLVKIKDTFFLTSTDDIPGGTFYNIYITSSEEIKQGDWFYNPRSQRILKCNSNHLITVNLIEHKNIILTTDSTLIADGVQSIDNKFLEWFVKNPACEFVETKLVEFEVDMGLGESCIENSSYYKITTPQEEPKETPQIKCYDKYNQLLKEGDYVDVQKDGVHKIYKKDDNQLYFAPYGEEDMVSAYFSNDIAKCDKDGCWINNDRYEDIEDELDLLPEFELKKDIFGTLSSLLEPKKYPIGGFAPGNYIGTCVTCKEQFLGAKRSAQCEPCAIEMVKVKVEVNDKGGIEIIKQDELEKAAERLYPNGCDGTDRSAEIYRRIFIEGANYQAERMYSEEEVEEIIKLSCEEGMLIQRTINDKVKIPYWRIKDFTIRIFEQVKKK